MGLGVSLVEMSSEVIRPFKKVLGSFDKSSFWRFEIKGDSPYENMFAQGLESTALKNLLIGLEGVALLYSVKDHLEKNDQGKARALDHANITIKLLTYFVKNEMIKVPYKGEWVKIAGGPVAVANWATSLIDCWQAIISGGNEIKTYDTDAAVFNYLAATGSLTAAVGYGAIAATFFAGAAATSSTGIGIAPGLLLVFTGSVIAIGGKVLAADADNTPIENMLLKTPWGTNPDAPWPAISTSDLQKQYIKAIRIINSFDVDIDHETITATIRLKRLEPSTIVTIHEVDFGISTSADGSKSTTQIVGSGIRLNDGNCQILKDPANGSVSLHIDLLNICPAASQFLQQWQSYYSLLGKKPKPDYIRLVISVDLEGDGSIVLPDEKKRVLVEKYYSRPVSSKIE